MKQKSRCAGVGCAARRRDSRLADRARLGEAWDRPLDARAAEALASAVGADLSLLEAELEKLASTGDGAPVTASSELPNSFPTSGQSIGGRGSTRLRNATTGRLWPTCRRFSRGRTRTPWD